MSTDWTATSTNEHHNVVGLSGQQSDCLGVVANDEAECMENGLQNTTKGLNPNAEIFNPSLKLTPFSVHLGPCLSAPGLCDKLDPMACTFIPFLNDDDFGYFYPNSPQFLKSGLNPMSEPSQPMGEEEFSPDDLACLECSAESDTSKISEYPPVVDISTPNISYISQQEFELSPFAEPFVPLLPDLSISESLESLLSANVSLVEETNNPAMILTELKSKNSERPVIAHLNINSISSKFEPLCSMVKDSIDFLVITESKLDDTFPQGQFQIEGFTRPIRLDRNRDGGGLIIFIRDGLTCREIKPRSLYPELECTLLELSIRQSKWLVVVGYNPQKENIGSFLEKLSGEVDKHLPKYDNLLMLGDWNSTVKEEQMANFCDTYNLKNLINEPTCFKSTDNPSSIDIILTNKKHSFQNSITVETGLSDFHKMTVTVMKRFFKKKDPIVIEYRDMKNFDGMKFRDDLRKELQKLESVTVVDFQNIFLTIWNAHAPVKKKVVRGNNAPFMNRTLSKAFMHRAKLKNKSHNFPTEENILAFKKYRNFCVSLLRKEKKKFYNNLDISIMFDNKKFWKFIKPLLLGKVI